jgi:hypothetical protein
MKHIFIVIFSIFIGVHTQAQEVSKKVPVKIEIQASKTIYTFQDQRNIPVQNGASMAARIGSLYSNVEKITYNEVDRSFRITFLSEPHPEELQSVFNHFNVYQFELIKD